MYPRGAIPTLEGSITSAASWPAIASAMGLRQALPMHTNRTRARPELRGSAPGTFPFSRLGFGTVCWLLCSSVGQAQKILMHGGVVSQFRVKGGRHNAISLHQRGLSCVFRQNLQIRARVFNNRASNENHLERLLLERSGAADHVAGNLSPVRVSHHGHVHKIQ